MNITECISQSVTKRYDLHIEYNGNEYVYVISTLQILDKKEFVSTVRRSKHYSDCNLKLKNSEKKKIKKMIIEYFEKLKK